MSEDPNVTTRLLNEVVKLVGHDIKVELLSKDENKTLYLDSISEDDELWLLQTPAEINTSALQTITHIDFDSNKSNVKLRADDRKRKFKLFTMEHGDDVDMILPKKRTKSFALKSLPIKGRIIMMKEDVKVDRTSG